MNKTVIFLCRDGVDGILSGIYDVFRSGIEADSCRLEMESSCEPCLFSEYRHCERDGKKAEKTVKSIRTKISQEALENVYRAALHKSPERADRIFRFILKGIRYGASVMTRMQDPDVYAVFSMNRYVMNEAHLLTGFVRFRKEKNGIFRGCIGPENDVLELVAGHFADRLPDERWWLYDEKRKKAAVHNSDGRWAIMEVAEENREAAEGGNFVPEEYDRYEDLWKQFFSSIFIEERRNPVCQRNMLPLRYRSYMTEFL